MKKTLFNYGIAEESNLFAGRSNDAVTIHDAVSRKYQRNNGSYAW